ncbi:MAG: hypothetical protein NW223_13655 [Hyphomicrobiaceae bacterium]|nr:hypothetical protein [Hyphomicrobiaceae bacterium]
MTDETGGVRDRSTDRRVAVVVIHGVGDTQPGLAVGEVVGTLKASYGRAIQPEDYAAVYNLTSRRVVEGDAEDRFVAYTRRVDVAGTAVRFFDLHWADLTQALPGRVNTMLGALHIIFESHHFIDAFLPKESGPLTRLLRGCLKAASTLLHWIVGISVCVLAIGFVAYEGYRLGLPWLATALGKTAEHPDYAAAMVLGITALMLLIAVAGLWFRYTRARSLEMVRVVAGPVIMWAILVIGFTWVLYLTPAEYTVLSKYLKGTKWPQTVGGQDVSVCAYIDRIYYLSQFIRVGWCLLVLAALLIIPWLCLVRRPSEAPSRAAMAATNVVVLQSALWLSLLSGIGVYIIEQAGLNSIPQCKPSEIYVPFVGAAIHLVILALAILALFSLRWAFARCGFLSLEFRSRMMPRLLFGAVVTLLILIGAFVQIVLFFVAFLTSFEEYNQLFQAVPEHFKIWAAFTSVQVHYISIRLNWVIGAVAFVVTALLALGSGAAIHISRDLIDHQVTARRLTRWRVVQTKPRRERISERLNTLVRDVICKDRPFEDLIFVVHSQGSVVAYDYLRNESSECKLLGDTRIHLITLGSPLSHLYEFYFKEYSSLKGAIAALRPRLASWVNLFRVDDYVGQRIEADDGFVRNVPMRAGGHMEYWTEAKLSEILFERVCKPTACTQPGAP